MCTVKNKRTAFVKHAQAKIHQKQPENTFIYLEKFDLISFDFYAYNGKKLTPKYPKLCTLKVSTCSYKKFASHSECFKKSAKKTYKD